jgi:DNA-binding GntR family transcriptional regulator
VTRSTRGRRAEVAEVTASIQAAIATGQFVPGELLPIPQLVRHFGVSAYPMVRSLLTLSAGLGHPYQPEGFRCTP